MKKTVFTVGTMVAMVLGTIVATTSSNVTNDKHFDAYYGTGYNYVVTTLPQTVKTVNVNVK